MSNAFGSFVDSRVDLSPGTVGLAVGDLLLIGLFVFIGEVTHGNRPFADPGYMLNAYVPFAVGWLLAALLIGAYSLRARESLRGALILTGGSWVVGDLVAQALRSTSYFHGEAAPSFVLVSLLVGLAFLLSWRLVTTYLAGGR